MQWDKMRKGGAHSHLSRWYDFMNQLAPLAVVLDKHRPKRLTAPEYFKARAEAGKGGGGESSSASRSWPVLQTRGARSASLYCCMASVCTGCHVLHASLAVACLHPVQALRKR